MALILVLLGWLVISSLWGFLPGQKPFAAASAKSRKQSAAVSGLLAWVTGALILYWCSCYLMAATFSYYAHGASPLVQGLTEAQVSSRILPVTHEILLQTLISGKTCFLGDPVTCEISTRALQNGFNPKAGASIAMVFSIFPALVAALINWKLTAVRQQIQGDRL